jgi:hypothetical protein
MMPPKMLTRMVLTCLSAFSSSKAFWTCVSLAPPPTSRKLAGSPPSSYIEMHVR